MPKVTEGLKYSKKYDEEILSKALEDIVNEGLSKKQLQKNMVYLVFKYNFWPETNSQEEEKILVDWVLESHKKGFPRRKEDLWVSVKAFLDEKPRPNPFKDNMPGEGWYVISEETSCIK
nr:unnamed protein product [Callosobruchus analis]